MKTSALLLLAYLSSALAAPAVVWKNGEKQNSVLRTSDSIKVEDVLSDVLGAEPKDSSLAAVVFLIGRGDDGSESLSTLASSGALPNVAMKYDNADAIHHHVSGVESPDSVVRDVGRTGHNVLLVSVSELYSRLTPNSQDQEEIEISNNGLPSKTQRYNHKRTQNLSKASVLVVQVNPQSEAAELDSAVVKAIDSDLVANVVLTGVRSHAEVKHERLVEYQRRLTMMEKAGRGMNELHGRRLEDQQQNENNNNNNQNNNGQNNNGNNDMTGVYYVSMTPNILAGILFTLLFTMVTWIGVSCMGMITGQDVYVSKLPPVGREA